MDDNMGFISKVDSKYSIVIADLKDVDTGSRSKLFSKISSYLVDSGLVGKYKIVDNKKRKNVLLFPNPDQDHIDYPHYVLSIKDGKINIGAINGVKSLNKYVFDNVQDALKKVVKSI